MALGQPLDIGLWRGCVGAYMAKISVTKVPDTGERHHYAVFVCRGDDFVVAHAASGLNHCLRARSGDDIQAIAEREKRVRCGN